MIRGVVIHMQNEQPLKADMEAMPTATDAVLLCTNLRYVSGAKPRWTDEADSWFMIPLVMVRFVEVPRASLAGGLPIAPESNAPSGPDERLEFVDLEPDEDLLRRIREA